MAQKDRKWHMLTEAAGVIIGFVLISFSYKIQSSFPTEAFWLFIFGLGNLIVDGYFLYTWRRR